MSKAKKKKLASATLVFTDKPDGTGVSISMEFDPPITDETRSPAQTMAARLLEKVGALNGEREHDE